PGRHDHRSCRTHPLPVTSSDAKPATDLLNAYDESATSTAQTALQKQKGSGPRTIWAWIKEFVLEFVSEGILQLLSCLLLIGTAAGVYWGWQQSPALTSGAIAVLLIGVVVAITVWRRPGPLRVRRLGLTLMTVLLFLALWFLLYGTNCGCL
ncbi:hypothetical protein ACWD6R_39085, partial [Streptomyces sp. NPDC005151]